MADRRGDHFLCRNGGDVCDNALAETVDDSSKTEVIRHQGRWKGIEESEFATLEWVR